MAGSWALTTVRYLPPVRLAASIDSLSTPAPVSPVPAAARNHPYVERTRNRERPDGGALVMSKTVFAAFLADIKAGRYDI